MSGHDLGLGEQRDYRLGEMPLPGRRTQPLIGAKRSRYGPAPSDSADSATVARPPKKVKMNEMGIQTTETIEPMDKKENDWQDLHAKLEKYKATARERDEWKKRQDELQITLKKEEIKHLKELYMANVGQISPATRNSDGSKDVQSRMKAQELCISSEPLAPPQASQSASCSKNTIPDPSDTYVAPQFHESFNQVARATMNEINTVSGRTLVRVVLSQRTNRSSSNSERISRAIVPVGPTLGETALRSRVLDISKNLVGPQFLLASCRGAPSSLPKWDELEPCHQYSSYFFWEYDICILGFR